MADRGWVLLGLRRDFWRRAVASSPDGGTLTHADVLCPASSAARLTASQVAASTLMVR